jgi:tether containing UBX domain for GLUT4
MRYANLPNNARLELIKAVKPRGSADATTSITLHLQDGARLKPIDFPATATLWNVLQDFEKQENGPLLGADDTEPVIIYLRDQISGTSRLKQTSLKSVGLISGRAVLRLLNRPKTNESMDIGQSEASTSLTMLNLGQSESKKKSADVDMMEDPLAGMPLSQDQFRMIQQISEGYAEYQRQSDGTAADQTNDQVPLGIMFPGPGRDFLPPAPALSAKPKKSTSAYPPVAVVRPQSDFANFKFPESSSISTSEDDLPTLLDDSSDPCNREQKVFHLDVLKAGSTTSSEDMDVDDSFFELTLEDLKTRMSTLKKMAVEDTPLMTACMRERLEESRFAQYQRTLIRVHFPDKLVLQVRPE